MTSPEIYQQLRPAMFGIAYRMLGSVSEAEDIVQEAFLRYHERPDQSAEVGSPKAYLSMVTTRLCIDHLRSARARRETYPGPWLPEPLLTSNEPDPAGQAEQAESLSMAFLLVLERLSPVERAVFLLHDVFSYDYGEIAGIVGKSRENCRQLALRARRHVTEHKPRFEASRQKQAELAARFFSAAADGNLEALVSVLAADAVVYGDSGGISPSWPRPVAGRDRVARLLAGFSSQYAALGITARPAELNGQPGAMFVDPAGHLVNVFVLDIAEGQVQAIRSVISRRKLQHLGELADLGDLRRQYRPPDRG
ncbi:MAG: RNA polymerase sigma-70 factor [Nocardiopsaceae bacterium]|jgi:RNA polymerase sigma-70 factor (ECF subfamily)|nr:RNA polymerase sigma-70 factor [Nocardiopsaceae bacterium]